jgi:hypothetical protein
MCSESLVDTPTGDAWSKSALQWRGGMLQAIDPTRVNHTVVNEIGNDSLASQLAAEREARSSAEGALEGAASELEMLKV